MTGFFLCMSWMFELSGALLAAAKVGRITAQPQEELASVPKYLIGPQAVLFRHESTYCGAYACFCVSRHNGCMSCNMLHHAKLLVICAACVYQPGPFEPILPSRYCSVHCYAP